MKALRSPHSSIALLLIIVGLATIVAPTTQAADNDPSKVAKVIILKGTANAFAQDNSKNSKKLKRGDWVGEHAVIKTSAKSFIKLLFVDKSQVNIGPSSQMTINAFPKTKAGILTLAKGKLRSKVTKDYMQIQDKGASKLFIKTRTAAMGVRGTDFQVNFNDNTGATGLIMFEGEVAMAHIEDSSSFGHQDELERAVSRDDAVIVRKGEFSSTQRGKKAVSKPIKISPKQLEKLQKNESLLSQKGQSLKQKNKKSIRPPIPPGMSGKKFSNSDQELDKKMVKEIGHNGKKKITDKIAEKKKHKRKLRRDNAKDQKAGGFVDVENAQYIPPSESSVFNEAQGVYMTTDQTNQDGSVDKDKIKQNKRKGVIDSKIRKRVLSKLPAFRKQQKNKKGQQGDDEFKIPLQKVDPGDERDTFTGRRNIGSSGSTGVKRPGQLRNRRNFQKARFKVRLCDSTGCK